MDAGWIGGIFGTVIGALGGAIGTYYSIVNTQSKRERNFVIKVSIVMWILVIAFVLGLLLLPKPYNLFLWIPYAFGLTTGIPYVNARQQAIRDSEAAA